MSRPTRARGLKLASAAFIASSKHVAPHAGAWIETVDSLHTATSGRSRAPRGRVD